MIIAYKVQRMIKQGKSEYISDQVQENKKDPKKLWQQLKNMGYKTKPQEANIALKINDVVCQDQNVIVNHFNSFFTTVAAKLVEKMPSPKGLYSVVSSIFKNFYIRRNPVQTSFILQPVSEEYVYKELSSLNVSKSTGLDDLPARFIRDGASVLTSPITFIINQSILTETVPSTMKQARVKPLFKKNSPLDVGNYRPVSILSIVFKVLERSVYNQLYGFLQTNGLLYELQSGFRSKYSTDSCLIHLLDFIRGNNDKGLYTGMIMLDLQKAFDTVDHTILCDKLEGIGVLSVNWFKSYLSDRIQYVSLKGQVSDPCNVSCGVPQGSILGPLLFLLYVNDMSTSIDEDCKLLLYADDSAILFVHKDVDFISVKLGKVLEKCSDWLIDNRLSLHLGKTECMLFGPPRKLAKVTKVTY